MSLHFVLKVNEQPIGLCVIQCRNSDRGIPTPDAVYDYDVSICNIGESPSGLGSRVSHRYGDGAWALVRRALDQMLPAQATREYCGKGLCAYLEGHEGPCGT